MSKLQPAVGQYVFLPREGLAELVSVLRQEGYTVVGPTVQDGVISLRPIESADRLAHGVHDEHGRGEYRLSDKNGDLQFAYVVGADSPKRYVFPPSLDLFQMHVADGEFVFDAGPPKPPKLAMLGIRPCDLSALQIQDSVFSSPSRCESDHYYTKVRQLMLVAVMNCTHPGANCFCASTGTGPAAKDGFDLALTELRGGFLVKVGSARGVQLSSKLPLRDPQPAELELAELRLEQAREHMGRELDTAAASKTLDEALDHPRWVDVAKRCLSCGNCTMVCPTCFCSCIIDSSDLSSKKAARMRLWDSCHTHQFTYTTAGAVRSTTRARYRHWMRHKLCTFQQQFNVKGCVGCGRCITWCPVGIDITEEAAIICGNQKPAPKQESEVVS